jgi:hypothetical protein
MGLIDKQEMICRYIDAYNSFDIDLINTKLQVAINRNFFTPPTGVGLTTNRLG